ncbi:ATP-binding cassette domain-containing protein [Kitasatospora sp. NPDC059673]|uniref:ATP-binding cassette domain-containing protein n=1 Tax=Kitasatospora sp. NPDC059673 TaxID=3346901 RepID=UPI0036AA47DB
MIQITGLTKKYRRGHPPAVLDLTFDARPRMITTLLGDEGAGKSTAFRLMVELERGHGLTLFDGRTYRRIRRPEREIGALLPSGRPEAGHPGQRARAHLRMLAGAVGVSARRADDLLEQVRLAPVADHRIGTFSPGMHCRLALAAALLGDPATLLLDAPAEGLSPRSEEWLYGFLRSFALTGGTVLMSTRSPEVAAVLADRVVTLDAGRLAADQPVVEFRRSRLHPEVLVRGPQMARLADLLVAQGAQVRREGGVGLAVSGVGRTEIGELAYRNGVLLHELADRVVQRPISFPTALPSGSGHSGQVAIRPARKSPVRQNIGGQPQIAPAATPVASVAPRPATVGRPATGPDGERTSEHRALGHRGLQAGRWATAALAPDPSAPAAPVAAPALTAPTAQAEAPVVDLTRRTPRGASALRRVRAEQSATDHPEQSAARASEPTPVPAAPAPAVPAATPSGPTPAGSTPIVLDAEQLTAEQVAANPTDAELLTPARIRGVGHGSTPAQPQGPVPAPDQDRVQVRLRPIHTTELRPAGQTGPVGSVEQARSAGQVGQAGQAAGRAQVVAGGGGASAVRRRAVGDENGSE